MHINFSLIRDEGNRYDQKPPEAKRPRIFHGTLVIKGDNSLTLMGEDDVCQVN